MIWKYIRRTLLVAGIAYFAACGHDQQLTSIAIEPTSETFGAANIPVSADAGLTVQLRALGSYIHPPVTKDITSQVTWFSNDVQLATVSPSGLVMASGLACGTGLISATVNTNHSVGNVSSSGAIVTGNMTVNVICFSGTGGGGPAVVVNFAGGGSGGVTSSPALLSCTSTCNGSFPSGTTVTLTASPTGTSTFGGWMGCDSVSGSGLICTLNSVTTNKSITVTFN